MGFKMIMNAIRNTALLFCLLFTITQAKAASYDGIKDLQCGANVDCKIQADVITKMTKRWSVSSKSTVYGNMCFEAIQRVKGIPSQAWSQSLADSQVGVCNLK